MTQLILKYSSFYPVYIFFFKDFQSKTFIAFLCFPIALTRSIFELEKCYLPTLLDFSHNFVTFFSPSICLSLEESKSDLLTIIFVLSKIPSLRFFTLSWTSLYPNKHQKTRSMNWLIDTINGENVNVHITRSFHHHPEAYYQI